MVLSALHFSLYISYGALAHLGERLPCKQEVAGSSPAGSTKEKFFGSSRYLLEYWIYMLKTSLGLVWFPFLSPLYNENENGMVRDAALPK